ncbi:vacuolar protein sorting-associated protein 13b [Schizosaccharomyces cryophilus OY26]|uniref:Vacuolar protein sorting-associated protein 13b n=1 Tax=Schizosaccharomyces cryophilus (strain OY26 / ATCC MYA-4695 / CBS 11777 / NBRC 106824 / NRRL Y48691) TaxID=653667 RepID=S9W3H8_SCHCR|nr:vacuolar protein sorting-associated protein 13b [Schizosaccharomyces cryophilus OY26]EPY52500.1 vacuolar protein sorting-associated protein 13b [Schizosaccharomyces cryophilus OY26]
MLEGLLANFLNRLLGEYIENFDATQLKVGVWNGDVTLHNLQLKRDALKKLELPISVQYGLIESLKLKIPWSSLRNKPVEIYIEGIRALASMDESPTVTRKESPLQQLEEKRREMGLWEAAQVGTTEAGYDPNAQTFTESLITRMIDNIQFNIRDIHVRFEHSNENYPANGYSFGLLLSEFSISSCNEEWKPMFIETESKTIHKLCSLQNLAVYSDETSECISSNDFNDLIGLFHVLLTDFDQREKEFLISPIMGSAKVTINKTPTVEKPRFVSDLSFEGFDLTISDAHLTRGISLNNEVNDILSKFNFRKNVLGDATISKSSECLPFVFKKVFNDIRQKNHVNSWPAIKSFCERRKTYIHLYRKKFLATALSPEETNQLDVLELNFTVSQLKLFRSLAYKEIKKEGIEPKGQKQQGWTTWMWNNFKGASDEAGEMTDDQKQRIIDAIGLNESTLSPSNLTETPSNAALFDIRLSVPSGRFSLKSTTEKCHLISLELSEFTSKLLCMNKTYKLDLELGSLRVFNDNRSLLYTRSKSSSFDAESPSPLFHMTFERRFSGEDDRDILKLNLRTLEFFHDQPSLIKVKKLFDDSLFTNEGGAQLLRFANNAVTDLTSQTVQNLRNYMNEKRKLTLDVQLQAPLIILPENVENPDTNSLVIDSGLISVKSNYSRRNEERQATQEQEIQDLIYDDYLLSLDSAKISLGPLSHIHNDKNEMDEKYQLLKESSIKLNLSLQSVPSPNFPKIRVSGKMSDLLFKISDAQYAVLKKLKSAFLSNESYASSSDKNSSLQTSKSFVSQDSNYNFEIKEDDTLPELKHFCEFDLSLNGMVIVLLRESGYTQQTPMASLELGKLNISYNQFDTVQRVELSLTSMKVNDLTTEESRVGNHQIFECGSSNNDNVKDNYPLTIEYAVEFDPSSSFKDSTTINFICSDGNFYLAKYSILSLLEFSSSFIGTSNNHQDTEAEKEPSSESFGKTKMTFSLHRLGVQIFESYEEHPICLDLFNIHSRIDTAINYWDLHSRVQKLDIRAWDSKKNDTISFIDSKKDQFLDLRYKTQQAENKEDSPQAKLDIKMGSFLMICRREPVIDILNFFSDFIQLKTVVESAKYLAETGTLQAEQGTNFDININISNPIFRIPLCLDNGLQAYVDILPGRFSSRTISWLPNLVIELLSSETTIKTIFCATSSEKNDVELDVLKDLNVGLKISVLQEIKGSLTHYGIQIDGETSDFSFQLSQAQYFTFLELASEAPKAMSIKDAFSTNLDAGSVFSVLSDELYNVEVINKAISHFSQNTSSSLNLNLRLPKVGLHLFDGNFEADNYSQRPLSRFILNDTKMSSSYSFEEGVFAKLTMSSFAIEDVRMEKSEHFSNLILPSQENESQFCFTLTWKPNSSNILLEGDLYQSLYVLSLDHLLSIFYCFGAHDSSRNSSANNDNTLVNKGPDNEVNKNEKSLSYSLRFDVTKTSLVFVADASNSNSQCLIVKIGHVSLAKQMSYSVTVQEMGLFVSQMDKVNNGVQILENFNFGFGLVQNSSSQYTSSACMDIDPLIFRISIYDLLLIQSVIKSSTQVVSKYRKDISPSTTSVSDLSDFFSQEKPTRESLMLIQQKAEKTATDLLNTLGQASLSTEELTFNSAGIQLALISDAHSLPVVDIVVDSFIVNAKDWNSNFSASTTLRVQCNAFNFAKSHWEPLLEPWSISLSGLQKNGTKEIKLVTSERGQFTLTPMMIMDFHRIIRYYLTNQTGENEKRPEGHPYEVLNETGYALSVHYGLKESDGNEHFKLESGNSKLCRFEDKGASATRLTSKEEDISTKIRVSFDEVWFPVDDISVHREGSFLYELKPRAERPNFLLVTVILLETNVKRIILSSPYSLVNRTKEAIEFVCNDQSGHRQSSVVRIEPQETGYIPLDLATLYPLRIRPVAKLGFLWSNQCVYWKSLLKSPLQYLSCKSSKTNWEYNYLVFSRNLMESFMADVYPFMQLNVLPPLQVHNLLPYEVKVRILEKNTTRNDWRCTLQPGESLPILHTDPKSLLLLGMTVAAIDLHSLELPIIYSPIGAWESVQSTSLLSFADKKERVKLNLQYDKLPGTDYISDVRIYSPYLIYNRTDVNMKLSDEYDSSVTNIIPGSGYANDILPYFFSFKQANRKNRAVLRMKDSQLFLPLSFDTLGSSSEVKVKTTDNRKAYILGLSIGECTGKFCLSKTVTFTPRYVFKNNLDRSLCLRQFGSSNIWNLSSKALYPVYLFENSEDITMVTAFPGMNNSWSSAFHMNNLGITHVKAYERNENGDILPVLLRVSVTLKDATFFITFKLETVSWPFKLKNNSSMDILYQQKKPASSSIEFAYTQNFKKSKYILRAGDEADYSWDFPAVKDKRLEVTVENAVHDLDISSVGKLSPWFPQELNANARLVPEISIVGLTSVITFNEVEASQPPQLPRRTGSNKEEDKDETKFKFAMDLSGLGLSLINSHYEEFAYATLRNLMVNFDESADLHSLSLSLGWFQIDNQLLDSLHPIALFPSVITEEVKEENPEVLQFRISSLKDYDYGLLYVKYASFLLQELSVELDDRFVFMLLRLIYPSLDVSQSSRSLNEDSFKDKFELPNFDVDAYQSDIFFEALHLQPTRINLTFEASEDMENEIVKARTPNSTLDFMTGILVSTLGNIHDAPVQLNSVLLENARGTVSELVSKIFNHYKQQIGYQMYMIAGRADFLGNPVGLFNNFASGVFDMFYEPYQGFLLQDTQSIGDSFARGTSSFMRKTIFGVSDSVSKLTNTFSKGLSTVTMDPKYKMSRRRFRSRNRPKQAAFGITVGANTFYDSMTSGFEGLRRPFTDGKSDSPGKFLKGFGKGVLGLATKPAIGLLDMTTNVSEGIRNSTDVRANPEIDKARIPRFVGFGGLIQPYKTYESLGKYLLAMIANGIYSNETYLYHAELKNEKVLFISTKHFLVTKANNEVEVVLSVRKIKSLRYSEHEIVCSMYDMSTLRLPLPGDIVKKDRCMKEANRAYTESHRLRLMDVEPF